MFCDVAISSHESSFSFVRFVCLFVFVLTDNCQNWIEITRVTHSIRRIIVTFDKASAFRQFSISLIENTFLSNFRETEKMFCRET